MGGGRGRGGRGKGEGRKGEGRKGEIAAASRFPQLRKYKLFL